MADQVDLSTSAGAMLRVNVDCVSSNDIEIVHGDDDGVEDLNLDKSDASADTSDLESSTTVTITTDSQLPTPKNDNNDNNNKKGLSYLDVCKYVMSTILITFSVVIISVAIFQKQTVATGTKNIHPVIAFAVFWGLLIWLAYLEGGLNCHVGLKPLNNALYEKTHPRTYASTTLAHKGDNLDRFIVGRQYLDLTSVFVTSFMVSAVSGATVLGLPDIVNSIFLGSGLAVILITIVFGQLVAQINAARSMLDFMNNYLHIFATYVALLVESTGILHTTYLLQMFFAKLTGQVIATNEPPKRVCKRVVFWLQMTVSVCFLSVAAVVTIGAILQDKTTVWDGVPPFVSIAILVVLSLVGGIMEALQIAMMAVVHVPAEVLQHNKIAMANCQLLFSEQNMQAFLAGRQIVQTVIMFVIARITTVSISQDGDNIFGVSDAFQSFLNTGILGALLSTIFASLSWRVMANTFPLWFLSSITAYPIIYLCLIIEKTGICYSAWIFAAIHKRMIGYKDDSTYLEVVPDKSVSEHTIKSTGGDSDSSLSHESEEEEC